MRHATATVAFLLLSATSAHAGLLVFPGTFDGERFEPAAPGEGEPWTLRAAWLDATATDTAAQASLTEVVVGPASDAGSRRAVGIIPLPPGATEAQSRLVGIPEQSRRFVPAEIARRTLAAIARATGDQRPLTYVGRPIWPIPRVPEGRFRVRSGYTLTVSPTDGVLSARLPTPDPTMWGHALPRFEARVNIVSNAPVRSVLSASHQIDVRRDGPHRAQVRVNVHGLTAAGPLELLWVATADPLGLRVLTHRPDPGSDGWFMVLAHADAQDAARAHASAVRDVVLAIDTSGSMRGEKIEQARHAVEHVLTHLPEGARFNLVTFGSEVRSFRPGPVAATSDALREARQFMDATPAMGRTHVEGALRAALLGASAATQVLFLTDGVPTVGELDPQAILDRLPDLNPEGARIFTLGVGYDVDAHLLDGLSAGSGGRAWYLDPDDELDRAVVGIWEAISRPVLRDVALEVAGLDVTKQHPARLPALFQGETLVVVGRYRGDGSHTVAPHIVSLRGRPCPDGRCEPTAIESAATFPSVDPPGNDRRWIAALWATRRVGELLRRVRLEGRKPAWVAEVVELATRYGILTEYTRFLADEGPLTAEQAHARATDLLETANTRTSGRWAVMQSVNERSLRKKTAVGTSANVYRDKRGRKQVADRIERAAGRTWYRRDGRWVDAPAAAPAGGTKPARKRRVKKFSREYMELLDNPDFAEAQKLEGDVTITLDDEQVEVY
jgi:Ca-activated chloride channel family protein